MPTYEFIIKNIFEKTISFEAKDQDDAEKKFYENESEIVVEDQKGYKVITGPILRENGR